MSAMQTMLDCLLALADREISCHLARIPTEARIVEEGGAFVIPRGC